MMTSRERTWARLEGKPVDRLPAHPLFMIYAADLIGESYERYLKDFRILVKGQMAVAERYGADLVSCCSDPWREAADCGTPLRFFDHQPPAAVRHIVSGAADLVKLKIPDPSGGGRMTDRIRACEEFRRQTGGRLVVLGWVEGPLAEAADLRGMNEMLEDIAADPPFAAALMDFAVEMEIAFALAQVRAGADMIGIGDAAASLVSPVFYRREVLPREKKIVDAVHAAGAKVRLHICGNTNGKFEAMAASGADFIELDYPVDIAMARAAMPGVCLGGNLNPVAGCRDSTPERIIRDLAEIHRRAGEPYILSLGCEVPPGTPEENVRAIFEYAASAPC
jgi:MtaA/CmuA family methyltransferase